MVTTTAIIITCGPGPILTSRDLQTSRLGLVSAGEGFNVSFPRVAEGLCILVNVGFC